MIEIPIKKKYYFFKNTIKKSYIHDLRPTYCIKSSCAKWQL